MDITDAARTARTAKVPESAGALATPWAKVVAVEVEFVLELVVLVELEVVLDVVDVTDVVEVVEPDWVVLEFVAVPEVVEVVDVVCCGRENVTGTNEPDWTDPDGGEEA